VVPTSPVERVDGAMLRVTGEFADPELEARYCEHRLESSAATLRIGAFLCALAFVVFIPTDLLMVGFGGSWLATAACRIAACGVLVAAGVAVGRRPVWFATDVGRRALVAVELAATAGFLAICVLRPVAPVNLQISAISLGTAILLFVPGPVRDRVVVVAALYTGFGFAVAHSFDEAVELGPYLASLALALVGGTLGAACVERSQRNTFAALDRERVVTEQLVRRIELADGERTELARRASEDFLTGLANRRSFFTLGEALCRAPATPLAAIIVDVDRFKLINDRYGHSVGDDALRHVASSLRRCLRAGDLAARLGGDEFVVLVHCDAADHAQVIAARARDEVARSPLRHGDTVVPMTVSAGVALGEPGDDLLALLGRADAAMYMAKRDGGDAVVLAVSAAAGGEREPDPSG
jgi:diguanylate cyclase (GGDEF)-like protein